MQKIDCIYIINLKKERARLKQTLMLLNIDIIISLRVWGCFYGEVEKIHQFIFIVKTK